MERSRNSERTNDAENRTEGTSRRAILGKVGGVGVLAAYGSSTLARAASSKEREPTRVTGTVVWEHTFTPSEIEFEEWYVSPQLRDRYGQARVRFDHSTFDRTQAGEALDGSLPRRGSRRERFPLDSLVGTEQEWGTYYERDTVGTRSKSDYDGPIWSYKEGDGLYTRTAPINVVWETPTRDLRDIAIWFSDPDHAGSDGPWQETTYSGCEHKRYVYYSTEGSMISHDRSFGTQTYCGESQYHIRTWKDRNGEFGGADGQFEIGSTHKDPQWHTCDNGTFKFEEAEDYVQDGWEQHSSADVGLIYLGNANDWGSCREPNYDYAAYIDW